METTKQNKIHLLSFAAGPYNFHRAKIRFSKNAENSKLFDSIEVISGKDLELIHSKFWNEHRRFINANLSTGYGNYLWKPYLINHTLNQINFGDILVYLDIGCFLNVENINARRKFKNYINIVNNYDSLAMQLVDNEFGIKDLSENAWNSESYLNHLNLNSEQRMSNQIQAGILFLKKTSKNLKFTSVWFDLCTYENYKFLAPRLQNDQGISRYDQSVFSPLYKNFGMFSIPDETFFAPNWLDLGEQYPIWAMRNRSGYDPKGNSIQNYIERAVEYFSNY